MQLLGSKTFAGGGGGGENLLCPHFFEIIALKLLAGRK